ncbi:MAG TPA: SurA N-terminal domain-containing protein [Nitrospirota bacterium]|nr:SurA N-terminal domain-containing protein [Nitrospirota bacterium]
MIEWIRKHMGWMMWIIVGLVTVTFLFFGIYPSSDAGRSMAKVGGYVISTEEFNQAYRNLYENYRNMLKDQVSDTVTKSLRQQALQELIVNRLLIEEAKRIGLQVSDAELQAEIMRMPAFARDGRFDRQLYDRILDRINTTPAKFEASQRDFILRQKLERIVRDGVAAGDAELRGAYEVRNPKAKPGDFEKNRDSFSQMYLAEKQRDAMTALLRNIQEKIPVKINEKALAS